MKIQLNQTNKHTPIKSIYNVILTLILAFSIVWIIYILTPYSHYSVYLLEQKNTKKNDAGNNSVN